MITIRQILTMFEVLEAYGLRAPETYLNPASDGSTGRMFAARAYMVAFNHGGYLWPEIERAALEYALEPQEGQYPKPWPSPGHIAARTAVARVAALLGNDDEGEASWAHMHRRMPRIAFAPDRDAPARWLHEDPAKNDALFRALDRFGGVDRFREIPTQDANPAGYGAAKKAWIACFTAARKAQGSDPSIVRQIVASQPRQIEERR